MKGSMLALLAIISFLLVSGRSSARLLENNLFFESGNPSAFDPNLNSVVDDGSHLKTTDGHVDQGAVQCDEEKSRWSSSSTENVTKENTLSFRLKPTVEKTKNPQLPADSAEKAEGVLNVLPKGSVTPSGPSPKVNSMVTEQRLSKSGNSPGVGHMQIFGHKSQDNNKSHHSNAGKEQDKSSERKLGSTPSPGAGN
jgi:hypothetical protein